MKFLRTVFILGYLFFGIGFLHSIWQLVSINKWFDLFPMKETKATSFSITAIDDKKVKLYYTFKHLGSEVTGERQTIQRLVDERLNSDKEQIIITYNSILPSVNYIKNLKLKGRGAYIGMVGMGFFLFLFGLLDLVANKRYWLKIYGIPE